MSDLTKAFRNGCEQTVPNALRYLAENERPTGGEDFYNRIHLYQLADEIEVAYSTIKQFRL